MADLLTDTSATPDEVGIQNAVATLMQDLPQPVQKFLSGPERDKVILSLSQKYGLHADQSGEFEHAFIFMLLGIATPEEFVQSLTDAGLPKETIAGLASDVNTQVFIPLRDAERKESSVPRVAPRPAPATPAASQPAPVIAPKIPVAPVVQPVQVPMLENTAISVPLPAAQPQQYGAPHPTASISAPAAQNVHIYVGPQQAPHPPQAPQPIYIPVSVPMQMQPMQAMPGASVLFPNQDVHPAMRTMATDMQLVKDLREGKALPQAPATLQTPPQQYVPPAPAQSYIPPVQPQMVQQSTPAPRIPSAADHAADDPYREPV